MKKALTILFALFIMGSVFAQDDPPPFEGWKFSSLTSLNLNQSMFSNWSSGGENTLSGTAIAKLYLDHKKNKVSWNNSLNMMLGVIKKKGDDLDKNEDLLDFNSIFGYEAAKKWDYSALMNFRTQFLKGFDTDIDTLKISNFMAPANLTLSVGMKYRPTDWFYLFISPITTKATFVMDQDLADIGAFGVKAAEYDTNGNQIAASEKMLWRYGAFLEAYMKKDLAKGLALESRFNVFYQYNKRENLESADADVNWETFLNYELNKWLAISFFVHFAYLPTSTRIEQVMVDDTYESVAIQNRQLQIKQTLGIGLSYTFGGPPE